MAFRTLDSLSVISSSSGHQFELFQVVGCLPLGFSQVANKQEWPSRISYYNIKHERDLECLLVILSTVYANSNLCSTE